MIDRWHTQHANSVSAIPDVLWPGVLRFSKLVAYWPQVAGSLTADTVWTKAESPYEVTGDVTVEPGVTLQIEPGVVVEFQQNTGITVRGRLVAEGSPFDRIQFDRAAGASRWDGIAFRQTLEDSRVTYADMRYGDNQGEAVRVDRARLMLDNIVWSGTTGTILELDNPSLIVRNSQFPASNGNEVIHGEHITGSEYLIIEGNVFANSNNGGDVIDFLGADRPGPVVQILNNVFLGGGDDGLDLDGTDAHIEGNVFMNFRRNTEPGNDRQRHCHGVAAKRGIESHTNHGGQEPVH